ncbi:ABC transporter substrate-binding protein [Kribbella deserti]|uniref:ABC transporter substrate-binding protein n=1 Tax=Kribbella deserti TaxID=1926257 RepID=A0ABV6QNL5_9ACTN
MNRPPSIGRLAAVGVAALALVLPLAACGSNDPADEAGGQVTLRFTWWGSDVRHQLTQKVIAAFEAENPNIKVKGEFGEWSGYWDKLATQTAANDSPDIIQMDEKYIAEYGGRGALLDLGKQEVDTADYDAKLLAAGKVEDKLVGLPVGAAVFSFVANPVLFKKYGEPLPNDATWSWDDFTATAKRLADKGRKDGVVGTQLASGDTEAHLWARQHGDQLFNDKGEIVVKPETLASWWQLNSDLTKAGVTPSPSAQEEATTLGIEQSALATNKMAIGMMFNTQLTAYEKVSKSGLKLLRAPGQAQSNYAGSYLKPSMYWSVSSRSKHPAEAAKFLDFLANSPKAADLLLTERGVPANTKLRAAITSKLTTTDQQALQFLNTVAERAAPPPPVTPVGGSAITDILTRKGADVLFGRATPEAAAEGAIREMKSSVSK